MKLAITTKADDWGTMPFFFNLSRPVGRGYGHPQPDDVMLVQFCFVAITTNTNQPLPAELKPTWSKVKVTGVMDENTHAAIDAWQQDRRKRFGAMFETDGIFSVAPPGAHALQSQHAVQHRIAQLHPDLRNILNVAANRQASGGHAGFRNSRSKSHERNADGLAKEPITFGSPHAAKLPMRGRLSEKKAVDFSTAFS